MKEAAIITFYYSNQWHVIKKIVVHIKMIVYILPLMLYNNQTKPSHLRFPLP